MENIFKHVIFIVNELTMKTMVLEIAPHIFK
jgi:hypothetical protein